MESVLRERRVDEKEREMAATELPEFRQLKEEVGAILERATWLEAYGMDWFEFFSAAVFYVLGLFLMTVRSWAPFLLGFVLYGIGQTILSTRTGHLALHGGVCISPAANRFWAWLCVEVIGSFSTRVGREIHIVEHHPHTNIVGRGDSSVWRAPFLPRLLYLFVMPLSFPPLMPLVAAGLLWPRWRLLIAWCCSMVAGLVLSAWPLVALGGFSPAKAVLLLFAARAPYQLPYLHFNVFQHIGLPMFDPAARPPRLVQMASGVLNLQPNPVLLLLFGHSLIDCHVEHHLFPRLSDSQCALVQPAVRRFLKEHGLPYNSKPYLERLRHFYENYSSLLVHAPPMTRFVGIQ